MSKYIHKNTVKVIHDTAQYMTCTLLEKQSDFVNQNESKKTLIDGI